jgi:hypothetical protein
MYINAGKVFQNAVEIGRGISSPIPAVQTGRESLASILLATISIEAFINELHHIAHNFFTGPSAPVQLKVLGDLLEEAERSRASIASKYQLAKFILSGKPFDKGAYPYQDFALLLDVRNLIVHAKPIEAKMQKDSAGRAVWIEPKIMVRLQDLKVLEISDHLRNSTPDTGILISDLISEISTQRVAAWACQAVAGIVTDLLDSIPADFAALTNTFYRQHFKIV